MTEKKLDNLGPHRSTNMEHHIMTRIVSMQQDNVQGHDMQQVKIYALWANGLGQLLTRISSEDFELTTSSTYNCWVQWNVK
jgi:hypothetical protein